MKYVHSTEGCKRYVFPTHVNELVIDRSNTAASEVFIVVLKDGEAPPLHQHDDMEQIFYIIEGQGTLTVGEDEEQFPVKAGDVVLIPQSAPHTIRAEDGPMRYFAVDSFCSTDRDDEPTWDEHVKVVCNRMGWSYDEVVS